MDNSSTEEKNKKTQDNSDLRGDTEKSASESTGSAESIPEASFSALIMSLASSSLMWMGLSHDPDKKIRKNKKLAMFNIDLLLIIQEKTKGNLSEEESKLLETIVSDLQMRYVSLKDEE